MAVILHSEVKATLTVYDAWLDLVEGFVNGGQGDGKPTSGSFPLAISPSSRAGILFSARLVLEMNNRWQEMRTSLTSNIESPEKCQSRSVRSYVSIFNVAKVEALTCLIATNKCTRPKLLSRQWCS